MCGVSKMPGEKAGRSGKFFVVKDRKGKKVSTSGKFKSKKAASKQATAIRISKLKRQGRLL